MARPIKNPFFVAVHNFFQTIVTINFKYILGSHSIVVHGRAKNAACQKEQSTV